MVLTNEFEIIEQVKLLLGTPSDRVVLGIGDDTAVLKSPAGRMLATVDSLIEGVHFDLAYTTAFELGYKALAVNLSDIASMGGEPLYALVSLGLRPELPAEFVAELYGGMKKLAKASGIDIVGGNIAKSPKAILVDVTVIGQAKDRVFTRSGARVGDRIAVTGNFGASAAGLHCLKRWGRESLRSHREVALRHLTPQPRISEARSLQRTRAVTAMIDSSDGLANSLCSLAKQSRVGILIEENRLPISKATLKAASLLGVESKDWALFGGEDYELVFSMKRKLASKIEKMRNITFIGEVVPNSQGVQIKTLHGNLKPLDPEGWDHFQKL